MPSCGTDGTFPIEDAYLCLSLTEPFEGDGRFHKLVAAIITREQKSGDWPLYELRFLELMRARRIEE